MFPHSPEPQLRLRLALVLQRVSRLLAPPRCRNQSPIAGMKPPGYPG